MAGYDPEPVRDGGVPVHVCFCVCVRVLHFLCVRVCVRVRVRARARLYWGFATVFVWPSLVVIDRYRPVAERALYASIYIFDLSTMATLREISNAHEGGVSAMAFSKDGKRLVSSGMGLKEN